MDERHIREIKREELDDRFIITFCGGNNGHPDWIKYLKELTYEIQKLAYGYGKDNIVIQKIETDMLDDVYYATVIVRTHYNDED